MDLRVVYHNECREHLVGLLAAPTPIVHAVRPGAMKETVCEHEFSMFREGETWTYYNANDLITCKTCRSILGLPPTL